VYFYVCISASFRGNDVVSLGLQLMSHAENETLFDESMLLVYSQLTQVCMYVKMPLLRPYLNLT